MRASYDSIDNKQKMCEKVNKDIIFIQFFYSTRLHSTELFKIFFSLLTLQLLFCKKLVGREKINPVNFIHTATAIPEFNSVATDWGKAHNFVISWWFFNYLIYNMVFHLI